jgi:ATP-dependent exoDNAse (exonuclease V) alpha subunit
MAFVHFDVKPVSRGRGSSAVSRAAYTAREQLHDERRHRSHDFRDRGGLEHAEIMLPTTAPGAGTEWAHDRSALWNRAEAAEGRKDARVAREYVIALPHELAPAQRLELARDFAQSIADRYGSVVDLAVHHPTQAGDARNHHAHILSTTRELTADGFGRKTAIELSDGTRRARGLPSGREEIRLLRHHWADLINEKLREARLEQRVDARSLWEQGSTRVPQQHLGPAIIALERAGKSSFVAERLRQEHAARERAMLEYVLAQSRAETIPPATVTATPVMARGGPDAVVEGQHSGSPPHDATSALSISERQQLAAERWLNYRRGAADGTERTPQPDRERRRDYGAEVDL